MTTMGETSGTETGTDAVRIERVIDAPAALVWRLWTQPEHLAAWYGPDGATVPEATMDVRVGGARQVTMQVVTPNGPHRMRFTGEYLEVSEPRRLVYTEAMADETGRVMAPAELGMPADHPTHTRVTVELDELDGRTRLTLVHAGIPADSPGASGWTMALGKLAALAEAGLPA